MSRLSPNLQRGSYERYTINPKKPRAVAMCDGCGFIVNHSQLRMQMDYRGGQSPVPTGLYHCNWCYDQPQPYFATPVRIADPFPVDHPRPDPSFTADPYSVTTATAQTALASFTNGTYASSVTATTGFTTASTLTSQAFFGGG